MPWFKQWSLRESWPFKKVCAGPVGGVLLLATACGTGTGQDEAVGEGINQAPVSATEVTATAAVPPTTAVPLATVATTTTAPPAPTTVPPVATAPPTTAATLPTDATGLLRTALENSATQSVRGEMRVDMSILLSLSAQFWSDGNQNFAMVTSFEQLLEEDASGFGFEMRFVEGVAYMRLAVPEEMSGSDGDATTDGWFTLDAESAAEMGVVCPSPLPGTVPDDGVCRMPNDNRFLSEYVQSAEIIGHSGINGISATQVRATFDYAALFEGYLVEPASGDGVIPFVGDMFSNEISYDIWIDGDGLIRRMSMDMASLMRDVLDNVDDPEVEDAQEEIDEFLELLMSHASNAIDYYDYGADIIVEAPSADEIVGDFGDLMGSLVDEAPDAAPADENS